MVTGQSKGAADMREAIEQGASSVAFGVLMFASVVHYRTSTVAINVAEGCLVVILSVAILKVRDAIKGSRRAR